MHSHLVFWISAVVRMIIVLVASSVAGFFWGLVPGLVLAMLGMMTLIFVQLNYLLRLADWLDQPSSSHLPDGWGAWTEVFSRLYKLRRGDEKNQAELEQKKERVRQGKS